MFLPIRRIVPRFRLRTLLVAVAIIGVGCVWLRERYVRGRREHAAVESLLRAGAGVGYPYMYQSPGEPVGPKWLRSILGDEFFNHAVAVFARGLNNPDALKNLEDLRYLTDVHIAGVRGASMPDFSSLTDLRLVQISQVPLTDRDVHLDRLRHVETLFLKDTRCTGSCLLDLPAPERLMNLSIEGPQTSDEGLAALDRLRGLKFLGLAMNHIGISTLRRISNLKTLTNLSLDCADVTDDGLKYVAELQNLEQLSLTQCPVTDNGIKRLSVLKKLSSVGLLNTKVTPDGSAALGRLMPHTTITRY